MDDLISRRDAIDALSKEINKGTPPFNDVIGSIRCGVRLARNIIEDLPAAQPEPEPVGCSGCRYERFGNRVCDVCSRFYVDRYEAERRSDG